MEASTETIDRPEELLGEREAKIQLLQSQIRDYEGMILELEERGTAEDIASVKSAKITLEMYKDQLAALQKGNENE